MATTKIRKKHKVLSLFTIVCGLLYIFAYQFKLPFKADMFLEGMIVGVLVMTIFSGKIILSKQVVLFVLMTLVSFIGVSYTPLIGMGLREAVLFLFFTGLCVLSLPNPTFIKTFTKWIYLASIVVVLSSILHFFASGWFNDLMRKVLREDAYAQLMWSYDIDTAFAGISAYTPNTTFSAAVVFGTSFLNITNKKEQPVIKNKLLNMILIGLSLFSIIICSKRGIFVATVIAWIVLMFNLYRRKNFFFKFMGVAALFAVALVVLYNTNEFVFDFLNRFIGKNFLTGRDTIYESLLKDFIRGNIFIGRGTAATYKIAGSGAHNIYIQLLYDHGIILSAPYYIFLLYNYRLALKNKCPLSIFIQTMFLVYGLSGNPLYSNMFMMIYIYYTLYAAKMPEIEKISNSPQGTVEYESGIVPLNE